VIQCVERASRAYRCKNEERSLSDGAAGPSQPALRAGNDLIKPAPARRDRCDQRGAGLGANGSKSCGGIDDGTMISRRRFIGIFVHGMRGKAQRRPISAPRSATRRSRCAGDGELRPRPQIGFVRHVAEWPHPNRRAGSPLYGRGTVASRILAQVGLGPTFEVAIERRSPACLLIAGSIKELHHVRSGIGDGDRTAIRVVTLEHLRKGLRMQHGISS